MSFEVPYRNTGYSHLRDAFLRAIRTRISSAHKAGTITPDQEDVGSITSYSSSLRVELVLTPLCDTVFRRAVDETALDLPG